MTETDEMALDERAPKEVAVDHQFLEMGLSWLSSARQEGAIASMVDDLTEYLRMHFDAEQRRGGFFDMVVEAAPRHAGPVAELRAEHGHLLEQLAAVRAALRPPYEEASEEVLESVAVWVKAMRAHEKREAALLQDAFNRDVGAGD